MTVAGGIGIRESNSSYSASGVTDANGSLTIAFPVGRFASPPNVVVSRQGAASTTNYDFSITALSATSVTIVARKAVPVTVLAISVLGANVLANGETLQVVARAAG